MGAFYHAVLVGGARLSRAARGCTHGLVSGLLLSIAVLVAVVAVVWKRRGAARALARLDDENAAKADHVVDVAGLELVDAAVARGRCGCGGRLTTISEGPVGELFVVHARCGRCGAQVRLRFRLPGGIQ